MPSKNEFPAVFEKFKAVLKKYERRCAVEKDAATDYYLNTRKLDSNNKPVFFGAASINKISVSFYLMPVYSFPDLLDDMSAELVLHKHGKSCFRFKTVEPALLKELTVLTKRAWDRFEKEGLV